MNSPRAFACQHWTITYPFAAAPALALEHLVIEAGERVLLAGATGAGKSTLLMGLLGLLDPAQCTITGTASIFEHPLPGTAPAAIGQEVGVVFQSPGEQCITAQVQEEVALGLRALGLAESEVRTRSEAALVAMGLADCRAIPPGLLSGGQQQRLALACAIARRPRLLVLDEPFSQLDPRGAWELAALLAQLTRDTGLGLLIAEHRWELARPVVDRILVLEAGRVIADQPMSTWPPPPPLVPRQGTDSGAGPALVQCEAVQVRFPDRATPVLNCTATIPAQGPIAIIGANGSGKSTLLSVLAGIQKPGTGKVNWAAGRAPRIAWVPQNPDGRLLGRTIAEDLGWTGATAAAIADLAAQFDLPSLDAPPLGVSQGQRLQCALASALLEAPAVLLLDEPTTGQDPAHLAALLAILGEFPGTLIFTTHDLPLVAHFARWVLVLKAGECIAAGSPDAVFADQDLLIAADLAPATGAVHG